MRTLLLALVWNIIAQSAFTQESETTSPWSVKQLVEYHLSIKQDMQAQDVYKLLYQAHFGVEHLLSDTASARSYLENEMGELHDESYTTEEVLERISLDDAFVRVNLRPFKRGSYDPMILFEAMVESARLTMPDTSGFVRSWYEFAGLVRYGFLPFSEDEVDTFTKMIDGGSIPPMGHSTSYRTTNKPAYRVVRREVIETHLPASAGQ